MDDCSVLDKLRGPKIFNMSVFDWITSLLGAWLIGHYVLKIKSIFNYVVWFIIWIILGIIVHKIFKIDTMLGYYLGINPKPKRKIC